MYVCSVHVPLSVPSPDRLIRLIVWSPHRFFMYERTRHTYRARVCMCVGTSECTVYIYNISIYLFFFIFIFNLNCLNESSFLTFIFIPCYSFKFVLYLSSTRQLVNSSIRRGKYATRLFCFVNRSRRLASSHVSFLYVKFNFIILISYLNSWSLLIVDK